MFDLATSPVFRPCRTKAYIRDLDSGGLVGGHRVHRDHPGCRQDYMGLQFVHSLLRDVRYVILSPGRFLKFVRLLRYSSYDKDWLVGVSLT
jgi:hypothetical protein